MTSNTLPRFAKRHYERIATAMQEAKPETANGRGLAVWNVTTGTLATMLERDNPRFDRDRFYRACEPGRNVRARS